MRFKRIPILNIVYIVTFLYAVNNILPPGRPIYRRNSTYTALAIAVTHSNGRSDALFAIIGERRSCTPLIPTTAPAFHIVRAANCRAGWKRLLSLNNDGPHSTITPDDVCNIVSRNIDSVGQDDPADRRLRFPESATVPVHAPRYINKKVRTRYKYSPIAKAQGLPNDETKFQTYTFSSHLHVSGGSVRGRRLCVPPVYLRPMMSRVKNALFAALQHMGLFAYGYDCKVIDLFCGSGSVGLEALSYGAAHCTFVDLSLQCCKATAMNAEHCNFEDKVRIVRADAIESVTSPWLHSITDKFDLLIACPPYEEVVYKDLMKQIANTTILNSNAVVVVEYPREIEYLPWCIEDGKLLGYRNRRYGRTVVAIYCYNPSGHILESCKKAKREFVPTTYNRKRLKIEGFIPKPSPDAQFSC